MRRVSAWVCVRDVSFFHELYDAEQYLASTVRTLTAPETLGSKMMFNERSVYKVPGTRTLVNLIRSDYKKPKALWVSSCNLTTDDSALPESEAFDMTLFSCRSGIGDRFLATVEVLTQFGNESEPRTCNWTEPTPSNLPDAHSRSCAGPLPGGKGIYLVGAQNPHGRDPVTLAISADGLKFDMHWAVNYGAPPVRHPGKYKGTGFQYPGAMVHDGKMFVTYSVGKEDIVVSIFPLPSAVAGTADGVGSFLV